MLTGPEAVAFSIGLFCAMIACMELGWRWGRREHLGDPQSPEKGLSTIQASVFGLMGLLLAFAFGGAETRLETRRQEIIEEINSISTAYARVGLLPPADQPALEELVKKYLDARLLPYTDLSNPELTQTSSAQTWALEKKIWDLAENDTKRSGWAPAAMLLLNSLDEMFNVTTKRTVSLSAHTAAPIFALLWILAPVSALMAGYEMAGHRRRSPMHVLLYSLMISATFYVILDLDSPRFGLIRLTREQHMLSDLRSKLR